MKKSISAKNDGDDRGRRERSCVGKTARRRLRSIAWFFNYVEVSPSLKCIASPARVQTHFPSCDTAGSAPSFLIVPSSMDFVASDVTAAANPPSVSSRNVLRTNGNTLGEESSECYACKQSLLQRSNVKRARMATLVH